LRALLDTLVLYVAAGLTSLELPVKVRRVLDDPDTERLLSAASIMEVAIKADKGLTNMNREHIDQAVRDLRLTLLPFSSNHSYKLFGLAGHHRDPFDRMLIATALAEDVPIISPDRVFKRYRGLRVIW
jgi:PIN domain nuclease of toxin-antitoxin system